MKFMVFSINIAIAIFYWKKKKLHLSRLFCCNHICYCVNMVSVTSVSCYITSASRYHPLYQRRSSMYIHGLIPRNFAELAEAVPIAEVREEMSHDTKQSNTFKKSTTTFLMGRTDVRTDCPSKFGLEALKLLYHALFRILGARPQILNSGIIV